jgi:hypothetical protein
VGEGAKEGRVKRWERGGCRVGGDGFHEHDLGLGLCSWGAVGLGLMGMDLWEGGKSRRL